MIYHAGVDRWDAYFLDLAFRAAEQSRCARRHLGAVLVRDRRLVSSGFNGAPMGSSLCQSGPCIWPPESRPSRTDLSGCPAVHAETNAILTAAYSGASTKDCTLYTSSNVPCKSCFGICVNAGIKVIKCLPSMSDVEGVFYDQMCQSFIDDCGLDVVILEGYEVPK